MPTQTLHHLASQGACSAVLVARVRLSTPPSLVLHVSSSPHPRGVLRTSTSGNFHKFVVDTPSGTHPSSMTLHGNRDRGPLTRVLLIFYIWQMRCADVHTWPTSRCATNAMRTVLFAWCSRALPAHTIPRVHIHAYVRAPRPARALSHS